MKHRSLILAVMGVLLMLTAGCIAPATPVTVSQDAIQTAIAETQIAAPSATLPPTLTATSTPIPTATITVSPTPTESFTPVPTSSPTIAASLTRSSATARPTATPKPVSPSTATSAPASSGGDVFYTAYVGCIGGTDLLHFLTENNPGEIEEIYKRDQYTYANDTECRAAIGTKVALLTQPFTCVAGLPDPSDDALKIVKQSTLTALADLNKIRESILGYDLCRYADVIFQDSGRMTSAKQSFMNAQDHIRYAQATLDQYRQEHGK
jgi:hypothetical protein